MRTITLTFLFVSLLACSGMGREWTNASGVKMEADLMGTANGKVQLRFPTTGKTVWVSMDSLSVADQRFVKGEPEPEVDPAEQRMTEVIEQNPEDPQAYINRGMARVNRGNYEEAIEDFDRALRLDPKSAEAYNGRGKARAESGKYVDAHDDFNKAIELNPKMAGAYRNRGDNLKRLAVQKETIPEIEEAREQFGKKHQGAYEWNLDNAAWQPLNHTTGNITRSAGAGMLAKADYERAEEIEREYLGRPGHWGGYGRGGYGYGYGGGYGGGPGYGGPGYGPIGPPGPGDPPLAVYPPSVYQGETITLVANPATLIKGMPQAVGRKPVGSAFQKRRPGVPVNADIESVDFYRDRDGNGQLTPGDELLATDNDGEDGFSAEVSTAKFPVGKQSYFALPKGAEGTGNGKPQNPVLARFANMLEQAARAEREIANQSEEAAKGIGYGPGTAAKLGKAQDKVADLTKQVADSLKGENPELAAELEKAVPPIGTADEALASAEGAEGEASKGDAAKAAKDADTAASILEKALGKLQEEAQGEDKAMGNPGVGAGEIKPPKPSPENTAGGPGKGPGEGSGSGSGDGDGSGGDDDDGTTIINNYGDDDDDDGGTTIVNNYGDDDDDVIVNDVVDEAEAYLEEGNYDRAAVAYDHLVSYDPDNAYYLRGRAGAYLHGGGYDYAIRDYDRLIGLQADDAGLYYNRGCAYLAAGELEKALSDFSKSISLNETWSLAYCNRGTTYARLGKYKEAIVDFDAALKIEPTNALAESNRALAQKKLAELEKALAKYDATRKLD